MGSVTILAKKIATDFDSDHDRVRAAFRWLTENIRYDLAAYYAPTTKKISFSYRNETEKQQRIQAHKDGIVAQVFSSGKSVCEGYAQTFKKLCDLLGIHAVVIKGYARNNGNTIGALPSGSNHAWNAVYLDAEWKLLDATWAAGYEFNGRWKKQFTPYFYFTEPALLLQSHFPENAQWQLVQQPISATDFANTPFIGQGIFRGNLKLIGPKTAQLASKATTFIIANSSTQDEIGYLFEGDRYGSRALVSRSNNQAHFTIDLAGKRNTTLTIFINGSAALMYKIL